MSANWFAMCPAAKAVTLEELMKQVGWLKNEQPRIDDGKLVVKVRDDDTGKSGELKIGLVKSAKAAKDAAEIADTYGDDRPDRDALAKYDARYELSWKKTDAGTVFDTALLVIGKLKRLCGAVIFNNADSEFV